MSYIYLILIGYCAILLYAFICYMDYLFQMVSERSTAEIDERLK